MFQRLLSLLFCIAFAVPLAATLDDADTPADEPSVDIGQAELVLALDEDAMRGDPEDSYEMGDDESRAPRQTKNAIYYAIAAGDLEAVRIVLSHDPDALNRYYLQQPNDPVFNGYHTAPSNGDTTLIYAVKTAIELHKAYDTRQLADEFTIQVALEHRYNIVNELLYHPKMAINAENGQGHTAASLAAQAGLSRLANMIGSVPHVAPKQSETGNYRARLAQLDVSPEVRKRISLEIDQLAQKHPAEKSIQINFLNALLDLPWDKVADTTVSIAAVAAALDAEHFALRKVKSAVLDYLASVAVSKNQGKGKIICLVGPPGTGKTSIVQSIAKGLNRPFARASLGGAHDESVIRGWNKSYVSACPGEILKGLIQAKVKNPVFLLDEIDKIGNGNYNGNPVSALLEALDPSQNDGFVDRYIELPFDLSQVIFIATANDRDSIPLPLQDRLEIIEVPGYSMDEKVQIAQSYLVPKVMSESRAPELQFILSGDVLRAIIKNYTREAGVRKLTQKIKTLFAKSAREFLDKGAAPEITVGNLDQYLGPSKAIQRLSQKPAVGVVNCLYAGAGGGGTSFLEVVLIPNGKGALKISQVLKEDSNNAMEIALTYVRTHAADFGIEPAQFKTNDIHAHKPGVGPAVSGPSAGIANVTALVSAFTNRLVDPTFAMTGELSLTGRVLAIGGLKDKLLAAKREGIYKVIIPSENAAELSEFKELIEDMEIIPVSDVRDVVNRVLLPVGSTTRAKKR